MDELYHRVKKQIHHYSEADAIIVKAKMHQLNITKGWDAVPKGKAGASVLCYRGNNIWLFKYNPIWGDGWEYDMTLFKDYPNHEGLESIAWQVVKQEGGKKRLPLSVMNN